MRKGSNGSTGTIYDSIHATQNVYEGTSIPKSFNINVGESQLWVHPNATKHMNEYVTKNNQHIGTFTASVSSQAMLSEFGSALNLAISKNNIRTDKIITGGNWGFKFTEPKAEGLNYVVIHARLLNK